MGTFLPAFLLAFGIILLAICGLALGVVFGRPPLKGSCGSLNCTKGAGCGACDRERRAGR